MNQACSSDYLPLLPFSQKSWRNVLHHPSPQVKGQKLVVHGPSHLYVCAHVCMCVFIYTHRDRKIPWADAFIFKIQFWASLEDLVTLGMRSCMAAISWSRVEAAAFDKLSALYFATVPTIPYCFSYTRIFLRMGSSPWWYLLGPWRHLSLQHLLQVQFHGKLFGNPTQNGQSPN